jgi:hypothetical protein
MRIVIGAYHSLAAAQRAARALELQMSIQNLVVRDQRAGGSRSVEHEGDGQTDERPKADFVLSMSGTAQNIEQARALLRAHSNVT